VKRGDRGCEEEVGGRERGGAGVEENVGGGERRKGRGGGGRAGGAGEV